MCVIRSRSHCEHVSVWLAGWLAYLNSFSSSMTWIPRSYCSLVGASPTLAKCLLPLTIVITEGAVGYFVAAEGRRSRAGEDMIRGVKEQMRQNCERRVLCRKQRRGRRKKVKVMGERRCRVEASWSKGKCPDVPFLAIPAVALLDVDVVWLNSHQSCGATCRMAHATRLDETTQRN